MKSFKIVVSAFAALSLLLTGCTKDRITDVGVDGNLPCVTDVALEEVAHASKSLTFCWNADQAIAAGASSFTVQLVTDQEGGNYDNYNSAITQTVQAGSDNSYKALFKDETIGAIFYARVRVNYPKSKFSEWVWLYDANGDIARIKVGRGIIGQEGIMETPYIYKTSSTSTAISVKWDAISEAYGYILEYKAKSASDWTCTDTLKNSILGAKPSFKITGLTQNVEYDLRAKTVSVNGIASGYCETISLTTREAKAVDPAITTATQLADLLGGAYADGDANAVYTLQNDIDMKGVNFDAIEEPFTQTLDGAGHCIKNLNTQATALVYQNNGTIKNLTIDSSCDFELTGSTFGAFAAINEGQIENVCNKANIVANLAEDATYTVGGICGSTTTALSNVTNYGNITLNLATVSNALAVAGITAISEAKLTGCTNNGKINVKCSGSVAGVAAAGIVGYCAGAIDGCNNFGSVAVSAKSATGRSEMGSSATKLKYNPSQGVAGIAAYVAQSTVKNCNNKGAVSYALTNLEEHTVAINRQGIAGIVGSPSGNIENCNNNGAVSVSVKSSKGAKFSGKEYIICAGGISGSEYYAKSPSQNMTNILNCNNKGKVSVDFDSSASNSTVGGIVGWPCAESGSTVVCQNCVNEGDVSIAGYGKGRFGGINGGNGNIVGCTNKGNVTNTTNCGEAASCLGGVSGYMSYNYKHENNVNTGNVDNNETGDASDYVYTGGLVGAYANQAGVLGLNSKVACNVSVKGTLKYAGMVLGRYNGANTGTVIASAEKPCLVKGRISASADNISAVKITSGNLATYATGNERAASSVGPKNVKFDTSVDEGEEEGGASLDAPKNLVISILYNSVTLTWDAVDGAEWYVAEYLNKDLDGATWVAGERTVDPTYTFEGLAHGTKYGFRVKAYTQVGSGYSETINQETLPEVILAKPVVTATPDALEIALTWAAVANATSYTVEYKLASATEWTAAGDVTETAKTISGLKSQTAYQVRVRANGAGGNEGEFCDPVAVTTKKINITYPYTVKTTAEFVGWLPVAGACSATDEVILGADIDLKGVELPTIETFAGILNGNGKALKNINASGPLFYTLTGTVKDLTIEGAFSQSFGDETTVGHPLAPLAISSKGNITNVTNKASVTITSTGNIGSPVVAGIVCFQQGGTFKSNKNSGAITLSHKGTTIVSSVAGFNRGPFSIASGLIGVSYLGTVESCENTGAVTASCPVHSVCTARHYIGGIIGTPEGSDVKNCINRGSITANFSEGGTPKEKGKQIYIAGIIGGRNGDSTTYGGANLYDCENYGTITIDVDYTANHYLAGIGGQPHVESSGGLTGSEKYGERVISGCKNYGKLIKKGAAQCRIGGLSAGAARCENSLNAGEIIIENIAAAGAVGGLVGYPTQPSNTIKNCKNTGKLTSKVDVGFAMGGLLGQMGNTEQNYAGCEVDCTIEAPASVLCGIIAGTAKTSAKTQTMGTAEAPFKVKGTVKGTTLTADNFNQYLTSDGAAVDGVITTAAGGKINVANVQFAQ